MELKLPVWSLTRLNWLLSIVVSAIVCIFLIQGEAQLNIILVTVITQVNIALLGRVNILILVGLAKRFGMKSGKFKAYRYLLSYSISAVIYLIVWPLSVLYFGDERQFAVEGLVGRFVILIMGSALANTLIVVLHNFVILLHEKAHSDLELSNLKTAHAEAANLLLKQQIHPHFLFNALNTVKALYRNNASAGDEYIVHLANFLRASVFNHAAKVSTLDEELALLKDYLEMQKIRFGAALNCTITVPPDALKNYYLPTFSLQPLLENAIKHNELTEEAPLHVSVLKEEDRIIVRNNLQKKTIHAFSANHGLANLTERYRLWSGDEVIIREEQATFSVSLKLLTNENSNHRG
jgi:two-component system LytT family sensor kinase